MSKTFEWTEEQCEAIRLGMTIVVHWEDVGASREVITGKLRDELELECGTGANLSLCDPSTLQPAPEAPSAVDHPAHYGGESNTYEAIKVIEAWKLGFCDGNVVKYISRWRDKGGVEDLKKARWYLDRFIAQVESESAK